jgi:hypothetical protein
MKRSEAVRSLAKMIITINNVVDEETGEPYPLDELQKATVYIACMEELGMIPPETTLANCPDPDYFIQAPPEEYQRPFIAGWDKE